MATTLHGLKTYYSNIMRADFAHIPGAHQTLVANLSAQVDAGSLSLTAAQTAVAALAIDTTSVATIAYNFFTGAVPREGGLDYLVSPTGLNPNNLNSAYYQSANVENRYINFAVNLGKLGEGGTRFAAGYGDLTLAQSTAKAYLEIFGTAADAAKVSAILDAQVPDGLGGTYTRADYFAFYGRDGAAGLGTKAALVGWLMAEAVKADTGAYAKANDAFLADLGADGVARFQTNLAAAYGPNPTAPGAPDTVFIRTPDGVDANGAAVIYDVVPSNFGTDARVRISAAQHQTVVLKDTSYGVEIFDTSAEGKANVDVHLDHFSGALTTAITNSAGTYAVGRANGGSITVIKDVNSITGPTGRVTLHVDRDSTVGYVSSYLTAPGRTLNLTDYAPVLDLKIVGAGSLTAQLGFANVDATDAGDLDLTWGIYSGGQTMRLGDGANTLKLFFAPKGQYLRSVSPPSFAEVYLGAGTDTLVLTKNVLGPTDPNTYDTLSNIHIAGGGSGAVTPPPAIFGFQKGVDKLVLDAQVHAVITNFQQLAEPHATLTEALRAISPLTPAKTAAVFTYRGDTYVYAQDQVVGLNMGDGGLGGSAGDGLIKLAGVTGLSVGTGAGAFDIHYG